MKTYIIDGKPIIRSCYNCRFFKSMNDGSNNGYCQKRKMLFAFTLKKTVFAIVKTFYLCDSHTFINEEELKGVNAEVEMHTILKKETNE